MTELERLLAEIDQPRELPAELRARLEQALIEGATEHAVESDDAPELLALDAARPVPEPLRATLEESIARSASSLFDGIDEPRELPPALRARLERALLPPPIRQRRALMTRALGIAASMVLLAAVSLGVVRTDAPGDGGGIAGPPASEPADGAPGPPMAPADPLVRGGAIVAPDAPAVEGPSFGSGPGYAYDTPPYALPPLAALPSGDRTPGGRSSGPTGDVVIGVHDGPGADPSQRAGFSGYVELLNEHGGVGGRALRLAPVDDGRPAADAIATVNLNADAIATHDGAPSWVRGPLLETMAATNHVYRDNVFGFASPVDRQARIAARVMFPQSAHGATAVIYVAGGGIWNSAVPDALEEVLRARGVTTVRIGYTPGQAPVGVPADAAFLSMPAAEARSWLTSARTYPRGIAGLYPLLDRSMVSRMPDRTRIVTPYALPLGHGETRELRRRAGRPLDAGVIHGWVTAKSLALALWLAEASSAEDAARGLRMLDRFDSGFAPPYETRADTNARTPEAMVYEVRDGRLVVTHGWLRDR